MLIEKYKTHLLVILIDANQECQKMCLHCTTSKTGFAKSTSETFGTISIATRNFLSSITQTDVVASRFD